MKTNYLFSSLLAAAILFASCEADDTADIVINVDGNGGTQTPVVGTELKGTYTSDLTLTAGQDYTLTDALIMARNTKLTIPAGTTIRATNGANVYIAISQGAEIDAQGTANSPIILTSAAATPAAGDWGGLILLGRAPINSTSGSATSTSEIGALPYGGGDASDYSGVIKYVRVEYSGGAADGQSENNGFSFYGVGNGTVVDHIQAFKGKDDGVEFFGGTVNVSFISVIDAEDDSVDWTEGYSGTLNNIYIQHGAAHDKGIEADGYNTDIGNNSNPVYFSAPNVRNLTIIGQGNTPDTEAVRLRAGTQGIFTNVLIDGFEEGFDLDGDKGNSPTGQGVLDDELQVTDVLFTNVTTKMKNDTTFEFTIGDFITGDGDGTGTDYASWRTGWTR
ncbi:multidrug transporter [Leeuwenhoekiella parthenopeia]|uniref:Multidrug transporter n=1 Tax=Leeuwenhoekiella parthenopeia TaxID=2890320 RepID=A0ABS8GPW1_9FLAO|nr:multidrug transporter [Leeuwenhoekiella parthenopeia]MCC4211558.1 multidrug transporter [Leeuwenhoekiella parthenopeia]